MYILYIISFFMKEHHFDYYYIYLMIPSVSRSGLVGFTLESGHRFLLPLLFDTAHWFYLSELICHGPYPLELSCIFNLGKLYDFLLFRYPSLSTDSETHTFWLTMSHQLLQLDHSAALPLVSPPKLYPSSRGWTGS